MTSKNINELKYTYVCLINNNLVCSYMHSCMHYITHACITLHVLHMHALHYTCMYYITHACITLHVLHMHALHYTCMYYYMHYTRMYYVYMSLRMSVGLNIGIT